MPPRASICIISDVPDRGKPETTTISELSDMKYSVTNLKATSWGVERSTLKKAACEPGTATAVRTQSHPAAGSDGVRAILRGPRPVLNHGLNRRFKTCSSPPLPVSSAAARKTADQMFHTDLRDAARGRFVQDVRPSSRAGSAGRYGQSLRSSTSAATKYSLPNRFNPRGEVGGAASWRLPMHLHFLV